MSVVNLKPIYNSIGNQCWLNTFVQIFSNNDGLMAFIRNMNTDLSNHTIDKSHENYIKLFGLTHFLVTTIDEMRNPSNTDEIYTISEPTVRNVYDILFGGGTYRSQDVPEVFTILKGSIVSNDDYLHSSRPVNPFHAFLQNVFFDVTTFYILLNKAIKLNNLQELIEQNKLTINNDYEYILIYVNRINDKNEIDLSIPLYTQKIIELNNTTTNNKRSYILTGIVCHPPGHYIYISCDANGEEEYIYDDEDKINVPLVEFSGIRKQSTLLVYKRTDKTPNKTKDKEEYKSILEGKYIPDTYSMDIYKRIRKYEKDIAVKLMDTKDKDKEKDEDEEEDEDVFSPPLFYFTINTIKTDDFDYLFYLSSEIQFCKTVVNNVPNPQYYDLFDMGETLKEKFKQSIEYTTEKFDQVYKKNEEKPVSNDVNVDLSFYNKRDILTGKTKNNIEQKYNLFYYSYKLNE
jgi:Ubiquitin carboxyl-terminal hydrolase